MSPAPGARAELEGIFRAALAAVDSGDAVRRVVAGDGRRLALDGRPVDAGARLLLLAAGKAAAAMAAAFEERAGARIAAGLAITKDGHGAPLERVTLREASHPVPDARCERAAREALALLESARPEDVLLRAALGRRVEPAGLPGGGSSRSRISPPRRARCSKPARRSSSSTPCAST